MADNLRHAQYSSEGVQIDDPQATFSGVQVASQSGGRSDSKALLPSDVVGVGLVNPTQLDGQPIGIVRPLRSFGKMVCGFGAGIWQSGSPGVNHTLTDGYTGFDASGNVIGIRSKTGQAGMLKVVCNNNAATTLSMITPATGILNPNLAGKFGLWVYVETQPGYQPGGSLAGTLNVTLSTAVGGSGANALVVGYNSNQIREGYNFLKFVMRDPSAYVAGTSSVEYHPFGINAACYGTGSASDIKNNPITRLTIDTQNLSGATLYFDSMWTDFDSQAQMILGCDSAGVDLVTYAAPIFQAYGWKGYIAIPGRIWASGSKVLSDWTSYPTYAIQMYNLGWENINHSTNHLANGTLTSASEIDYEIAGVYVRYNQFGMLRGAEFYASPQSSSSRLSEAVIKNRGIKIQRHARKSNISVTPYGIDNPNHVGAIDIGSVSAGGVGTAQGTSTGSISGWQTFSKIKRYIDVIEAYGDTGSIFWHGITTLGDTGSGEDLTGDNLLLTYSAFAKSMEYLRARELAGKFRVCDGFTGFYYGTGR